MHVGNFVLQLHSHLPYVLGYGRWPHGSDWLCEAVAECYIPLLNLCHKLLSEDILPNISIDFTPILCEQLADPRFPEIFETYCKNFIEMAQSDEQYFLNKAEEKHLAPIAAFWRQWYEDRLQDFKHRYQGNILAAFKTLQDERAIEILPSAATHAYLPLLAFDESVAFQLITGKANYLKHFQREPRGIWLPECAYRPAYRWKPFYDIPAYPEPRMRYGLEQFLSKFSFEFFFVDFATTEKAIPLGVLRSKDHTLELLSINDPEYIHFPYNFDRTPLSLYHVNSTGNIDDGTAIAFTRHKNLAMQVWSRDAGYPGDPDYLDFHKRHFRSNLRYWKVTDVQLDMMYKQPYSRSNALRKADLHAFHFNQMLEQTARVYHSRTKKFATICTMFDTELFGHWWFEGPEFLYFVLKGLSKSPYVKTVQASEQIDIVQPHEVMAIPESSWGDGGDHRVWFNEQTRWLWYALYQAEQQFHELMQMTRAKETVSNDVQQLLTQIARELLLLQSSDWPFLISTKTAKDYAEHRFIQHYTTFSKLCTLYYEVLKGNTISEENTQWIETVSSNDNVFQELSVDWWHTEPNILQFRS